MADKKFIFTSPDGKSYEVVKPKGLPDEEFTQERAMEFAKRQFFPESNVYTPKSNAEAAFDKTNKLLFKDVPRAVGKYVSENVGDIVGGGVGGVAGLMVPGGPIVKGAMSAAGGVLGATAGKEADQARLGQETSVSQNLAASVGEEVIGRVAGGVFAGPVSSVMRWLGFKGKAPDVQKEFLETGVVSPTGEARSGIKDAQERVLGGRELTVFEETGGAAGRQLQAVLDREVMKSTETSSLASQWQVKRNEINEKLVNSLRQETISTPEFESAIKDSFVSAANHIKQKLDVLDSRLLKERQNVRIPFDDIESEIMEVIPFLDQKIDKPLRNRILNAMRGTLMKEVIGENGQKQYVYKDSLTLAEIESLSKNVEGAVKKFNPAKDVQAKDMAVYKVYLEPLIANKIEKAKKVLGEDALRVLEDQATHDALSRQLGELRNSKVGRSIGMSDFKQDYDSKTAKKLDKIIFESPDSWDETREILDVVGAADVQESLVQRYRYNVFKEVYDPASKSISASSLQKAIKDPETVAYIGGEDFLRSLMDAEVITRGLKATDYLSNATKRKVSPVQEIAQNAVRTMAHPLYGRMRFVTGVMSAMKGTIGLGEVTDKHLFKALQGERGENLIRKMTETPLVSPESYGVYVQVARELTKAGADITMFNREAYYSNVLNALNAVEESE